MAKWMFATVLMIQAHFAASYLVPLDETSKDAFAGLLRWAWPWEIGDGGLFGEITATGFPLAGFFVAVTAALAMFLAALAVLGYWVPYAWWRTLVVAGCALSIILMVGFFGPTKLLPIAVALFVLWATVSNWASTTWLAPAGS